MREGNVVASENDDLRATKTWLNEEKSWSALNNNQSLHVQSAGGRLRIAEK